MEEYILYKFRHKEKLCGYNLSDEDKKNRHE